MGLQRICLWRLTLLGLGSCAGSVILCFPSLFFFSLTRLCSALNSALPTSPNAQISLQLPLSCCSAAPVLLHFRFSGLQHLFSFPSAFPNLPSVQLWHSGLTSVPLQIAFNAFLCALPLFVCTLPSPSGLCTLSETLESCQKTVKVQRSFCSVSPSQHHSYLPLLFHFFSRYCKFSHPFSPWQYLLTESKEVQLGTWRLGETC